MRRLMAQTVAIPTAQRTATDVLQQVFAPTPCPDDFAIQAGAALGLRPKSFVTASADATLASGNIALQSARYASALKTPGAVLFGEQARINCLLQILNLPNFSKKLRCVFPPGYGTGKKKNKRGLLGLNSLG